MKVLVTGAAGFVGRNLTVMLGRQSDVEVVVYDLGDPQSVLDEGLKTADVIFHLAGVNRPEKPEDYATGNAGFTREICDTLRGLDRKPLIILSSSIQAALENPYGISKRDAESALLEFSKETGASVVIFRMKNVFGKWCRPNYNSAVATFCHNIARGLPITVSNRDNEVNLVYIDDVCTAMMEAAGIVSPPWRHYVPAAGNAMADIVPSFKITLGELVDTITGFKETRSTLRVPAFNDPFTYRLYATYLSYLEESNFAYGLDIKTDERGSLAEFLKSSSFGQIFVSRTKPGITRGNHFHHTKTEKFLVVEGEAIVRFRKIGGGTSSKFKVSSSELKVQSSKFKVQGSEFKVQSSEDIIEYRVSGKEFRVVDIPPGYTHSIENVGPGELVTLFWANQVFDPQAPDTWFEVV
ncbi:MAG: NAD-dependent epimerase/dehydratase family protein [Smithellaceae bacterium]|nr:NAD-dependent epimerase/dehydratase family protein [Smithellaceae bacterium]